MRGTGPPSLPRELVRASAGTGKTFWITSRILGLVELGAPPDEILASTFARKAAGEILEAALERLARAALDQNGAAAELSGHALLAPDREAGSGRWSQVLRTLLGGLHRASVGTLDAFFVRTARCFALELELPPSWGIADEPTARRLESEALQEVLAEADPGQVVELVRMLLRGDAARGVHDRILDQARDLRNVLHQIDPAVPDPWRPFERRSRRSSHAEAGEAGSPDAPEVDALIEALRAAELPTTSSGAPHGHFRNAVDAMAERIEDGDWEALCTGGLGKCVVDGSLTYYSRPFTPELEEAVEAAVDRARVELSADYRRQTRGMERLARAFDVALTRHQREEGAYRFEDVTRLLGGPDPLSARPDLWFRLDQRARHLLLDEFQDTSLPQWEALRPLAEELLSGHAEERSAVIVADPKQSIYGWRGADPELVRRVGERFALDHRTLDRSWRSSRVVLDFVNEVFADLPESPLWEGPEGERREPGGERGEPLEGEGDSGRDGTSAGGDRGIVREWARAFSPHRAARDLPGHVRMEAGPREEKMRRKARPRMMARAAERVAELRREAPGHTIGVLTRHNEAVARIIAELRSREVEASEEGGVRLTDSPAVSALLALLRMADHPAHSIAHYHVAATPLGEVAGVTDWRDRDAARRVARRVRGRLLRDGYGRSLERWIRALDRRNALDHRDARRLLRLVELGFRWDDRATLRPDDFARFVESETVEDPTAAGVRVMTVHRAKGLEFDIVVLPELDTPLTGRGGFPSAVLPERDPTTGRVLRVFPYVKQDLRPLFPEVAAGARQARAAALRDALGILYVALTRARHALHLLVAADDPGGSSSTLTFARVIRTALGVDGTWDDDTGGFTDGDVLHERGSPRWWTEIPEGQRPSPPPPSSPSRPPELRLPERRRMRLLAHRTPSGLEGGRRVEASDLLRLRNPEAMRRGSVVHAWCRKIGWIDDGIPDPEILRDIAARTAPGMAREELDALSREFRKWLEAPPVRKALGREHAPEGARLERELPFAVRLGDEIVEGVIDRLVLELEGTEVVGAAVLDFKTDAVEPGAPLERRAEHYRPQLREYRRAVARRHGLDPDAVEARLVFLRAGAVHSLRDL